MKTYIIASFMGQRRLRIRAISPHAAAIRWTEIMGYPSMTKAAQEFGCTEGEFVRHLVGEG